MHRFIADKETEEPGENYLRGSASVLIRVESSFVTIGTKCREKW